ncbi:MAG: hypothetical protein ABFS35_23645 [Bacteroidota bacterium]
MKKNYIFLIFSLITSATFAQITLVKDIATEGGYISGMAADNEKILFRAKTWWHQSVI